jgi:hypothetical protein
VPHVSATMVPCWLIVYESALTGYLESVICVICGCTMLQVEFPHEVVA